MSDVRITTELVETLDAIRKWYPGTADPPRGNVSQTQVAYGSKMPAAAAVLSLRRDTLTTLTRWAFYVAVGRGLTPTMRCRRPVQRTLYGPEPRTGWPWCCGCGTAPGVWLMPGRRHPLSQDVDELAGFLATHADWLGEHAGRAVVAELAKLADALEEVVKQTRPARVKVARCPEPTCDGVLTATVRRGDSVLPSAVRCNLNPVDHAWSPAEWQALGRRTRPLMNVAAAARLLAAIGDVQAPRGLGVAATIRGDGRGGLVADIVLERDVEDAVLDGLIHGEDGDTPVSSIAG